MKAQIDIKTKNFEDELIDSIDESVLEIFDEIKLMPDTHIGKSVPIGFVGKYTGKIIPAVVGVDIGCGMLAYTIDKREINFEKLEEYINRYIPSGYNIHEDKREFDLIDKLSFRLKHSRILRSIGTLGGGNHFIEIVEGADDFSIIIHTGSRSLGAKVCEHHQSKLKFNYQMFAKKKLKIIEDLLASGQEKLIQDELTKLDRKDFGKEYLSGEELEMYINDMKIAQEYATLNRRAILNSLLDFFEEEFDESKYIEMPHNYIDFETNTVRKGSISAKEGENLVIPLNMKEGVIFAKGKGNEDWFCSAPHGAGRKYSRNKARDLITLEEFEKDMKGINTFSVCTSTIDEAPGAYKDSKQVIEDSYDTLEIIEIKKPIYNFKAKS